MAGERAKLETILGRLRRTLRIGLAAAALTAATCGAAAQGARPGVTAIGDAAVTGFSGAPAPDRIAPGEDAAAQTFIDRDGPSLRIVDLRRMGGPPEAQLVGAPKIFTVRAARIGQVFGVAFDDSNPPNVYVAASSAYGLPIVAPKSGGGLIHIRLGAAGAVFMPGLWGPNGGPGAIWRLDGATGEVRLFAMVATDGRANSGAALGGLAFDSASKMLFVADRETGLIHRISGAGADLGTYDHGVTGRAALGLAPAPWRAPPPLDVAKSAFDSAQPATWGYAGPQRLIFGLAVHDRRLYYAVVDGLQVWSVGLGPDGAFGSDARLEIAAPPSNGPTEISKIAFDAEGRIYLAERAAPTGAFDFEALAQPAIGRVLRYAIVGQTADGQRIWQQTPDAYAIGFPEIFRNGNGGVAIGYGYLETGAANRGSCDGFLWTTGEQLRVSADAKIAARLARGGESHIDGLQGNPLWRILRDREPPFVSYFISYADNFADPSTRGHMGDIDIRRLCEPGPAPSFGRPDLPPPRPLPPDMPPPKHRPVPPQGKPPTPPSNTPPVCKPWQICGPPGTPPCPPNQIWRRDTNSCAPTCPRPNVLIAGQCCPPPGIATPAGAACSNSSCPSGQTAIGPSNFCCPSGQVYANAAGQTACCAGALVNGQCSPPTTPSNPNCQTGVNNPVCCPSGYVPSTNACCLASQLTSTGVCCPAGRKPTGPNKAQCGFLIPIRLGPFCCAAGKIPVGDGSCCLPGNVTTSGVCCPSPVDPANRAQCRSVSVPPRPCAAGYRLMPDQSCCLERSVRRNGKSCGNAPPLPVPVIPRRRHADCSTRGPHYIPSPRDPSRCLRCPRGKVANDKGDACVAVGGHPPPRLAPPRHPPRVNCARLGPRFIRNPDDPSTCMRCPPGAFANANRSGCVRAPYGPGFIGPPGYYPGPRWGGPPRRWGPYPRRPYPWRPGAPYGNPGLMR